MTATNRSCQGRWKNIPKIINTATATSVILPISAMLINDFEKRPIGIKIKAANGTFTLKPCDNKIAAAIRSITPRNHIIMVVF